MVATNRSGGDRVANGQDSFPQDGLPSRPMDLAKDEMEVWSQLIDQIPNDLLRRVDAHNLKTICELICLKDRLGKSMKSDPEDMRYVAKYLSACQQINRLSGQYGLSPIDRRRMKLEPQEAEEQDEW